MIPKVFPVPISPLATSLTVPSPPTATTVSSSQSRASSEAWPEYSVNAILYEYTKIHRLNENSSTGYEDGWNLEILGIHIAGNTTVWISASKIYPDLFDRNEIIKVGIDNYSQYNNYFEYTDNDTINKIYIIFRDLITNVSSRNDTPENPEELYKVIFFNSDDMLIESNNDISKAIVYVYKKDNKYYVEEPKNGIYQITEEDFNTIKNYAK